MFLYLYILFAPWQQLAEAEDVFGDHIELNL
jgi:hypothetical protein